ncbi:MAG: DUF1700 domain-containing protein [Lachnospiraceae bacterium]|nr:DUF1700 domain-containing protein [Lachnospiraceae bacterium]
MDKKEFIEKLQRSLASGLNSAQVADNIRYYQDYIESEILKGKSEEEVISNLGDPRLLAKSIIEANKHSGDNFGSNREFDDEVKDKSGSNKSGRILSHILMMPAWLTVLIVVVILIIGIGIITSLISIFAPVIIAVLVVLLIVNLFQGNSKPK